RRCSVKPQNDLSHKGQAVEEWADLRFFRPIGIRIARALYPTGISPDQVTLWSILIGLVAGHLFAYRDRWTDLIGVVLFIVSDVFDSADGQLARLRGTSTRLGRALDGTGDTVRVINLYFHLLSRPFHGACRLGRELRHSRAAEGFRAEYSERQQLLLRLCSWLGQNIRFVLLGVAGLSGHIAAYPWAVAVPMSLLLVVLVLLHEWNATALGELLDSQRDAYAPVS